MSDSDRYCCKSVVVEVCTCKDVSLEVDVVGITSTFFCLKNMEPSSTEGGAEETLPKNHPPSLVSAEIK